MNIKSAVGMICWILLVSAFGGTRPAYAAPPKDACSLLTPAQVSAVLGISAKPHHGLLSDATECGWTLGDPIALLTSNGKSVDVKILDSDTWAYWRRAPAAPLKGMGDYAFYVESPHSSKALLFFKKGNSNFSVNVNGFPLDQIKNKEKTLALDILAKL